MSQLKIAVAGASGRMGRKVVSLALNAPDLALSGAWVHKGSSSLGQDAGTLSDAAGQQKMSDVVLTADYSEAFTNADVVIDFGLPSGLSDRLDSYLTLGKAAVVCVTGLSDEVVSKMQEVAKEIPLVYAANTSVGITLLRSLVEQASAVLGEDADIEILEAHHTAKRDAPSGTALALGESAARGRQQKLDEIAVLNRNEPGALHEKGSIGFATLRAGDVVGEHTVYLVTGGERLELTHRVSDRKTFASGALRAAQWLQSQPAGYYDMNDVLGLDVKQ